MTKATIIPSLTNNPPSRANPAAFPTDGDSFLNDLPDLVSGVNTAATELNTWNAEVETFKNQASSSQTNAASSSTTSLTQARNAAASQVSLWVSGTTYAVNQMVYSNADGRQYKRILAGAGTTDPSSDPTNWESLGWEYITNYPDIRPTLDLNFAGSQAVDPRITFTRNSIATYFDKFGVMQTAGVNQPRIDFDPITGECKGLLIEEQRTNLLLRSEEFDNAYWNKSGATITANTVVSPDGALTGDSLISNSGTRGSVVLTAPPTLTISTAYSYSIYAKSNGYNWVRFQINGITGTRVAWFDLATGTIGTVQSLITAAISSVGNGWYRCTVSFTADNTSGAFSIIPTTSNNTAANGNGFNGIYIWGAQLEAGSFPTSYIPTTTAQVTRAADSAVMTGTNFSSWYNQGEGTLYAESAISRSTSDNAVTFAITAGSTLNNSIFMFVDQTAWKGQVRYANNIEANLVNGSIVSGEYCKSAMAFKTNDASFTSKGSAVSSDTSVNLPAANRADIGFLSGLSSLNGTIKRITYYPKRLPNATLQAITQP